MTRRFLAGTSLATLAVIGLWSLASAQTVSPRSSTEYVPTPRPREASSSAAPRSAFPKSKNEIEILHALVTSSDPIKLPAREAGSIVEVAVKRGYEVKMGDVVGQIDDTDAMTKREIAAAERDAAQAKAESEFELQAAEQGVQVSKENYDSNVLLSQRDVKAVSLFDLRRSKFEWQRAVAQVGVAKTEQMVARHTQIAKQAQIVAAENEIRRRKLTSPVDGVVIQVFKHVGDWAQPGDAVMEIIRMNKVEVDGWVLSDEASPAEVFGKPVTIYVDLPGPSHKDKPHVVKGHITFASQVMQGSGNSRQFRVSTEVENEQLDGFWVIQPGTEAKMVIDLKGQAAPRPTPPALKTSPIYSRVEALKPTEEIKPAEEVTPEPAKEPAPIANAKPAEVPAAERPMAVRPEPKLSSPKAEAIPPKEEVIEEPKAETPAPMPKLEAPKTESLKVVSPKTEAPKAKPEVTGPANNAAVREVDVYSPKAYGSRTAPKTAPKTNTKD